MVAPRWLSFLTLGSIAGGASAARVASAGTSRAHASHASAAHSGEQTNAFTVFSTLLKDLQAEEQEGNKLASGISKWCADTESNKVTMIQAIQRQIDEAAIVMQQVASDEKRLQSELNLVSSTGREREQQLKDADATGHFRRGVLP